jgi:cytochrome bd-type quinol oxidase subunit 2
VNIRRPSRTAQLAIAAALAWAVVVLPYLVWLALDVVADNLEDAAEAFTDIPALAFFALLPLIALVLSVLLGIRLMRDAKEGPRDRTFAIALLVPGLVWMALAVFQYLDAVANPD